METRASYLLVGIFVIVGIMAMLGAAIYFAGSRTQSATVLYDIYFDGAVAGLKPGNAVQYRGIPVGSVIDMRIDPENIERVLVSIEVRAGTPVREDTEATLALQGITGVSFIQLTGGTQQSPALRAAAGQNRPVIRSRPSQLAALFDAAPELLSRAVAVMDALEKLLSAENKDRIDNTLANVEQFTGDFVASTDKIDRLLTDGTAVISDVRELTAVLAGNSGDISKILSEGAGTVEDVHVLTTAMTGNAEKLEALLSDGADTLENVSRLTGNLADSSEDIERMMVEGSQTMTEMRELSKRTNSLLASIEDDIGAITQDTSAVLSEMRRSLVDLSTASGAFAAFMEDSREPLTNFSATGLYELSQLMAESRVLVAALSRLAEQIERDPARFLFGDQQQGVEVE